MSENGSVTETFPGPPDGWDPAQYRRFAAERAQPFHDLLGLCRPLPGGRAVDLGCGTGELTAELHRRLGPAATIGLDRSATMLAEAAGIGLAGVTFAAADIAGFGDGPEEAATFDLVCSNAALHWVPGDHGATLARWRRALRPGGQLAVQVPANADHASHRCAAELAAHEPYLSAWPGQPPPDPVAGVLRPEVYAQLLYDLGFAQQHVRLQVYGHVLTDTAAVVEWMAGTSLTRFRAALEPALYQRFVADYRTQLVALLGDRRPYFYAFKRILLWGRLT